MNRISAAAIDLGATSGRVIVGTLNDSGVELNEVHRFPNAFHRLGANHYWDVGSLFAEVQKGLVEARRLHPGLASCGVDTWGVDHALVDGKGRLVTPVHAYRDGRTAPWIDRERARDGGRRLHDRTGLPLLAFNTLFQLAESVDAIPALRQAAERVLLLPDYFNFLLCGRMENEVSIASTTQLLGVGEAAWDLGIAEEFGIPSRWFASPPVTAGRRLGPVAGIPGADGLEVVLVPGHDTSCAYESLPGADDALIVSAGTWLLAGAMTGKPLVGDEAFSLGICNERRGDGGFRPNNNLLGLWLLERVLPAFRERPSGDAAWNALIEAASAEPAPAGVIDTSDASLFNPADMRAAIDAQLARRGLAAPTTLPGYVSLICHSLAASIAGALERMRRLSGRPLSQVMIVGGGARNRLLGQLAADACGVPVTACQVEGTTLGNLGYQFVALGALPDLATYRTRIAPGLNRRRFEPSR